MTSWSYDSLWQKTKLYVQRALEAEREGPLFPFWAILALELLGRATLAKEESQIGPCEDSFPPM